jgi:hypothetical protein
MKRLDVRDENESRWYPYLREARDQLDDALWAYGQFENNANRWLEHTAVDATQLGMGRAQVGMYRFVQVMLVALARASLLFFPSAKAGSFGIQRGATLRRRIGIPNRHALNSRTLRNGWLHFDERLDKVTHEGKVVPNAVTFARSSHLPSPNSPRRLRLIVPDQRLLYVLGQEYDLAALAEVAKDTRSSLVDVIGTAPFRPAA